MATMTVQQVQVHLRHAATVVGGRFSITIGTDENSCYIIHYEQVGNWPHENMTPVASGTYSECLVDLIRYVNGFKRPEEGADDSRLL